MKLQCNKKLVIIFLLMFMLGNLTVFAQALIPQNLIERRRVLTNSLPNNSLTTCEATLAELYDIETMEFLKFLEQNFQNKSSTSSLSNIAIARFNQFKTTLDGHLEVLSTQILFASSLSPNYAFEYMAYVKCSELTGTYIARAKEQLLLHIKNTAVQKKATMLLEKLQVINSKLRTLNLRIAEFYGFFATFKNKLPGFLSDCL